MTKMDSVAGQDAGTEPAALGLDLWGDRLPVHAAAPNDPLGHSPLRRPGSIRRTMSIEVDWPDGDPSDGRFHGRCRDIFTPFSGGDARPIAMDEIVGRLADRRSIGEIESVPARPEVAALAGARAGSHLRSAVDDVLHREKVEGAPLYLLLDDLAGASLVCMWGWARWNEAAMRAQMARHRQEAGPRSMEGVCIGFRPGSAALDEGRREISTNNVRVPPLPNPEDAQGWHEFARTGEEPAFRRARLIDVWREGDLIRIEAIFQDSTNRPGTTMREAIHEYRLAATADANGTLLALAATAGALPYAECLAAPVNTRALIGTPMADLRATVLERLKRTAGCTHLNDMMRSLAEVPTLAAKLGASKDAVHID